ncbi:MAG: efflux RND transporter periplasmic adaptor subunit [Chloroflexi bacterium]|nr:efflux RND transporter periplasmic adaptor subunit [Chloroflexota bacterium]
MSEGKKKQKIEKKYYYIGGIVLALILIIVFSQMRKNASSNENLLTTTVEKGELIATVGGTGKVEANKSAILSWKTSGNVSSVYVENENVVTSGTILAELAPTSLPQNVILAQADLVDAQRNLETAMESDTQRSQIYLNLLDAEENLKNAKEDIDDWNYNNADLTILESARSEFIAAEEILKQAQTILDQANSDAEKQELQTALDDAQNARDKALRNLSYILGKSYNTQVAQDFAKYDLAKAQLADAQRDWERVKDGQNTDDILAAQAKVTAAEAVAGMAQIQAPFDGTVTMVMTKIGDEVSTGTSAFRIDDLSKFYVEVDIPEIDIHKIQIGQDAEFTFDSLLDKTYHGKVVEVSGAGVENQGAIDFTVKLLVTDSDKEILPGMTASVSITVLKMEDTLIVPNRAIRLDNGDVVVYVLRNGNIDRVTVKIGSSSDSYTQILSGDIQENDSLVLNPPQDLFNTSQRPAFTR